MSVRTLVVLLSLLPFATAGCLGGSDTFTVPALHVGDWARYDGAPGLPEPSSGLDDDFRLSVDGYTWRLGLHGERAPCIVVNSRNGTGETVLRENCLDPVTFDPIVGGCYDEYCNVIGGNETAPFSRVGMSQSFSVLSFVALKATAKTWREGEAKVLSYFGAPVTIELAEVRGGVGRFEGNWTLHDSRPGHADQQMRFRFEFREGESLPKTVTWLFSDSRSPFMGMVGRMHRGSEPLPSLPGVDWAGVIARLQPKGDAIYPEGGECPENVISLGEALAVARERDPEVAALGNDAYLAFGDIWLEPPPAETGHTILRNSRLFLATSEGKEIRFRVYEDQFLFMQPQMMYERLEDGERGPLRPGDYPPTMLPYCDAVSLFLKLGPSANYIYFSGGGSGDSGGFLRDGPTYGFGLIEGSSWGSNPEYFEMRGGTMVIPPAPGQGYRLSLTAGIWFSYTSSNEY